MYLGMSVCMSVRNSTRDVLRLVWPFDGIVQKHITHILKRLI